jgi:hypothetical protein
MEDERIPQQVQKNSTMVEKNMNLSLFFVDVNEPHFLWKL